MRSFAFRLVFHFLFCPFHLVPSHLRCCLLGLAHDLELHGLCHPLAQLLEGGSTAAAVAADLERRSFALIRADNAALATLRRAESELIAFFRKPEALKEALAGRSELGGTCGYNRWPLRQQWHGRSIEAQRREVWPEAATLEAALLEATDLLGSAAGGTVSAFRLGSRAETGPKPFDPQLRAD